MDGDINHPDINHPDTNSHLINHPSSQLQVTNYTMAEDAIMLDPSMDMDTDAPPVPSTPNTSAATSRRLLRPRRILLPANEKRGNHQVDDSLKPRPDSKVQKSSSNTNVIHQKLSYNDKQRRKMIMTNAQRNRKLRIQQAIANGSFQVRSLSYDSVETDQGEPHQLERLNMALVTQALYSPVPGMAFDPTMASFSEADMDDLVQALEAFQRHLARRGSVILSDRAGALLRAFARDVLAIVLLQPEKPGCNISEDDFWTRVSLDYQQSKKLKWLTVRVTKLLESTEEDTAPQRGKKSPFAAHVDMVVDALKAPGNHPVLDKVCYVVHPQETLGLWHSILTALPLRRLRRRTRTSPLSLWPSRPPYDASWATSRSPAPDTWPDSTTPLMLATRATSALTSPRRASASPRETRASTPPPRTRTTIFRVASSTAVSRTIPRSRRGCLPRTPSGSWRSLTIGCRRRMDNNREVLTSTCSRPWAWEKLSEAFEREEGFDGKKSCFFFLFFGRLVRGEQIGGRPTPEMR